VTLASPVVCILMCSSCTMAQASICWSVSTGIVPASLWDLYRKSGTGTGFSSNTVGVPCWYHSSNALYSYVIIVA